MVLINGVKYACERCIRGHRVTTCNHTDQPLTMIKPKGRPSTTCSHCKEMRKNKNSNPSGQCTCGKQDRRRSGPKSKDEADCLCKTDPDHCPCHKKRAPRRRKQPASGSTVIGLEFEGKVTKQNGFSSYQSLTSANSVHSVEKDINNLLASPVSVNTSFSTGWDAGSVTSSNRSPENGQSFENKHTIGLDPLATMKPITPQTRTKVGEVYIPLTEYVPNSITSTEGETEHINPMLLEDDMCIFNDLSGGIPSATYFADTSKPLSYTALKEQRKTFKEQPAIPELHTNDLLLQNGGIPMSDAGRSASFISNVSSHESLPSSVTNHDFLTSLNSSDSLSSMVLNGNTHHYQDMLHHSNNGRGNHSSVRTEQSPNVPGVDTDSVRSVEVLSITPSFMDIPESSAASIGSNSSSNPFISWKSVNSRRERSISINKNRRYDKDDKRKRTSGGNVPNISRQPIKSMILPVEPPTTTLMNGTAYSFNSPPDSVNTALSANTQCGDPSLFSNEKTAAATSISEPLFATDLNQSTKHDYPLTDSIINNNYLFSEVNDTTAINQNDLFPTDFADIDELMTAI